MQHGGVRLLGISAGNLFVEILVMERKMPFDPLGKSGLVPLQRALPSCPFR